MKISVYIMAFITAVLVILTVSATTSQDPKSIFSNWFIVILLGIFCVIQLVCIFTGKYSIKRIGSYFLHIGLVLFLIGSFMYFVSGEKINIQMPIDKTKTYGSIQRENGSIVNLGFDFGITDLKVDRYPNGAVKFYNASMLIFRQGKDTPITKSLYVNGPHTEKGFKIYLMSYNEQTKSVSLLFKKNAGEWPCIIAIFCSIIGSFIICLFRKKERGTNK